MSPERQRARRRAALWLLAAGAVVLGAVFALQRSRGAQPPGPPLVDPLSLVPAGPAFVLTVDVARLRTTDLGRKLVGMELERLVTPKGGAPWHDCQPLLSAEVDRLAVSVPSVDTTLGRAATSGATPGVIAAGRFLKHRALMCALGSAGSLDATVSTTIGSFDTRRDPRTTREVAARDGLLVESEGAYFRALLDRAEQAHTRTTKAEDTRDKVHAELRRIVGKNAPIVASLVLSHGWLPSMLGDPAAEASPLADIRAAALRLELTTSFALAGTLLCERDEPCARLEHFLTTLRTDLVVLNPDAATLLNKLTLVRDGTSLNFSGTLDLADLDHLSALASPRPSASAAPAASP
jgi:hypothetical protein